MKRIFVSVTSEKSYNMQIQICILTPISLRDQTKANVYSTWHLEILYGGEHSSQI